jgi:hypothetical protein
MDYYRTESGHLQCEASDKLSLRGMKISQLFQESVYTVYLSEKQLDKTMYKTILVSIELSEKQG